MDSRMNSHEVTIDSDRSVHCARVTRIKLGVFV